MSTVALAPEACAYAQRMANLAAANEVRSGRARLRRDLGSRRVSIAEVIDDPAAQSMPVCALLRAQRGWGEMRVRRVQRLLARCSPPVVISGSRLVRDLSGREREALLGLCVVVRVGRW